MPNTTSLPSTTNDEVSKGFVSVIWVTPLSEASESSWLTINSLFPFGLNLTAAGLSTSVAVSPNSIPAEVTSDNVETS